MNTIPPIQSTKAAHGEEDVQPTAHTWYNRTQKRFLNIHTYTVHIHCMFIQFYLSTIHIHMTTVEAVL
jgi:hypothetical protein